MHLLGQDQADIVSASRPPPTLHRPELGPQEPRSCRNDSICFDMWVAFMTFQRLMELLWASLGSLRRPVRSSGVHWESLGVLGGSSGVPLGVLWGPGGSSGGPRSSLGVVEEHQTHRRCSRSVWGSVLGAPWGDSGRLGWSLGPTQEVKMLIFRWFYHHFCDMRCFLVFLVICKYDLLFNEWGNIRLF